MVDFSEGMKCFHPVATESEKFSEYLWIVCNNCEKQISTGKFQAIQQKTKKVGLWANPVELVVFVT